MKTPEVIQQVAGDLFQKFGFDKTSMDDIARKAHKAKRSIYNHFNSKEALFCATVNQELLSVREKLRLIVEDEGSLILTRLNRYLLQRVDLIAEARTLQVAMKNKMQDVDDYRFEEIRVSYQDFVQWEHSVFDKFWKAKPTTDSPEEVQRQATAFADMLQVVLNGLNHSFFVEGKYESCRQSYEMLVNLIVGSISQNGLNLLLNNNIKTQ